MFALLLAIMAAGITLAVGIIAPDWGGVDADPISPDALGKLYQTELTKWTKVAQEAKLKPQ